VFVVDDILLTYIVLPYGKRLLGKGQDWLFNWLDSQLGEEGVRLKQSMSGRNDEVEVLKDLGHYVKEHPGTADTLAKAAYAAATGSPGVMGDTEFLMVVRDFFLTPVVEMVKVLERPAVAPGFLTGTDWLTAIDVRTVPRGERLENMDVEQRTVWGETYPAEIVLWRRGRLTQSEKDHWLPRIWLVRAGDDELARELDTTPGELSATLDELARDEDTTPGRFADVLEHQPFVTAITRQRVVVRRAQMMWGGIAPPSTTGQSDRISWAKSSAGIQTMREGLERQLGDQQVEQERWIQALTNWASGSPAAGGR
jgi:hypothetical protein